MNIEFDPEKHVYFVDGIRYPSVTEIIAESDGYGTAANFFTREAAIRGNFIHRIVELDILDRLDTDSIDQALMPYYTAWKKFRQENMLTVESVEKPMASPVFMYAGTPDIVGTLNGEKTILDLKSGAPSPATGVQIAGYKVFLGVEGLLYRPVALHLQENGKYKLISYRESEKEDKNAFFSFLHIYRWKQNNKLLRRKVNGDYRS